MSKNKKVRIAALNSITCCRRELGRLYRAWRLGELENDQLRAGVVCLKELRECLTVADLEVRVQALENEGPGNGP